jgi:hypothetical protein
MTKTLAAAIATLFMAGCDVGEVPINAMGAPDGGGSGSAVCANAVSPAPAHPHTIGGTSNAGTNCMQAGACHLAGSVGGGPAWTFAGTLYTDAAKTAPKAGATIRVTSGGQTFSATTDADGNFSGATAVTFPANTSATSCPSLTPMVGTLVQGQGGCNQCHVTGGTTSPLYLQ